MNKKEKNISLTSEEVGVAIVDYLCKTRKDFPETFENININWDGKIGEQKPEDILCKIKITL